MKRTLARGRCNYCLRSFEIGESYHRFDEPEATILLCKPCVQKLRERGLIDPVRTIAHEE